MLLSSPCAGTVVLKDGLQPPQIIMSLLIGDDSGHLVLLSSLCACSVVLRDGLRPPLFMRSLLVGMIFAISCYSCHSALCSLKRWPAATSFHNGPAYLVRPLPSRASLINLHLVLLVEEDSYHLALLLSHCAYAVPEMASFGGAIY